MRTPCIDFGVGIGCDAKIVYIFITAKEDYKVRYDEKDKEVHQLNEKVRSIIIMLILI